jgi:salicylate hydroxylase
MSLRISVVGGGLGGLTAALALLQRGFDVTVFEQASELGEIGAGVQVAPNAMKVLSALGLERRVLQDAFEPEAHVVRQWQTGKVVARTQMKGEYPRRFGAHYYGFHRADLHAALVEAFPATRLRLNARCVGVGNEADKAVLLLADGSRVESDVVVGADGIHSVIRESVFGRQSPRFTGVVCWRGLVPATALPPELIEPDMTAWFGPRSAIVHYYVRGGHLVNWAAFTEEDWREESWRIEGNRSDVARAYQGWAPTIRELVSKTERLYKWAIFDREPLAQWSSNRVTLLGDAAHPMLPYLAQGACMALEDGYALGAALGATPSDPVRALQAYEAVRRPRATRVQLGSRARAKPAHLVSPLAQFGRNIAYAVRKAINPSRHTYGVDWIYEYDVTKEFA